jgi:hypothetical protein
LKATRGRLFATKAKNERVMILRHILQKQRWLELTDNPSSPAPRAGASVKPRAKATRKFRTVKVRRH